MEQKTNSQTTILIVDPDEEEREKFVSAFEGLGFRLLEAASAESARLVLDEDPVDLVLCELVLPDLSGFAFCRALREHRTHQMIPVMLISHWTTERDRILAFEVGADDFTPKPFFDRELASRVRAVLRRCEKEEIRPVESPEPMRKGDLLEVRLDANEIYVDGKVVPLTPREFALVLALVRRRGRVLRREELILQAWGDLEAPNTRSVDAHIKSIRRKLGLAQNAIETVRGLGYRLTDRPIRPVRPDRGETLGGKIPSLCEET